MFNTSPPNLQNQHIFKSPISISDFSVLKQLGSGVHGSVCKVQYKHTGNIYALKQIKQSFFDTESKEIDFMREKEILYDITKRDYPSIMKLYADFQDNNYRYLIMEFSEGIGLHKLRGSNPPIGYVDQNLVIYILTQLLETLKFLHDTCHVIHRDIKPDNIVVGKDNKIKLLDFGLSVYLVHQKSQLVSNRSIKGATRYAPPEVIFYPLPLVYDYRVDIFSLGFTIYSLMNPSDGKSNLPEETEGKYGNIRRYENNLTNTFYERWLIDFVKLLYQKDQFKRPTAAGALNFLSNFVNNPSLRQQYNNMTQSGMNNNSNVNLLFRRESSGGLIRNPIMNNINNNIYQNLPVNNMSMSEGQINLFNNMNNNINNNSEVNRNFNRFNSEVGARRTEIEEFLPPNMGNENRIKSSMKCLLYILYKLDNMNFINAQLQSLLSNCQFDIADLSMNSLHQIFNTIKQLENGQINLINYDKEINNFITKIFINNNSGISGVRPMILFYMMTYILKNEFKQYFDQVYPNTIYDTIINNNYTNFSLIVPMQFPRIYNSISQKILSFKELFRGPFVDNFYFIILLTSNCPQCNNVFGISDYEIGQFLQLDVPDKTNNIQDLVNNFFMPKPGVGNYDCKNCGCKGKKLRKKYCLNLPNYLFLEFEDRNQIIFGDKIAVPLYNGQNYFYQYHAGIYKRITNGIVDFVAVVRMGNAYFLYSNEKIQPCHPTSINSEMPSLALYKKVS